MKLMFEKSENGLRVGLKNKKFSLRYPKVIWQKYPKRIKNVLIDNLAYLLTINFPLIANVSEVEYNTAIPLFKKFFDIVILKSIPGGVEEYPERTEEIINQFLNIRYVFEDPDVKIPHYNGEVEERAIVSFSSGKDSLMTFCVANEIGLNPVAVYINDTVSPKENKIKKKIVERLDKELDLKFHVVRNEIEQLNDFDYWDKDETFIGYSHMVTGFCFMALPFSHFYKAKYILVGNQQNMNFYFINKDGFFAYPAFDQTSEWTKQEDKMIRKMTGGKVRVASIIEPLTNIALIRILHKRYGELAKNEVSCDCLDASYKRRWCLECPKCARISLFMRANGINPKRVGIRNKLLGKEYKKFYCLFIRKEERDTYEKSLEARDEELLAFYMAYKRGEKGYLIDLFKKRFLKEAKSREDELFKKFFSIHKSITIPQKIKKKVLKIYKEELKFF